MRFAKFRKATPEQAARIDVIHATEYRELGYQNTFPGMWRFVDLSSGQTIGYNYPSKKKLLEDLKYFAGQFGATKL